MPRHSEATLAAIKSVVDIATLVGDYLPLHRSGSRFKALCPFHDDHNPSLVVNPDRQSFKCWSCGAGGDIFDFVMGFERVDFPEALRMLAERAGVVLERTTPTGRAAEGPSKMDLLAAHAWAESLFARTLAQSPEALEYVESRGLSASSVEQFRLGFAPDERDWLLRQSRRDGISLTWLEASGLVTRGDDGTRPPLDRFRGRLIFPIRDLQGRPIAFGGRVMPWVEASMKAQGMGVAKYLNSPETLLFQKRKQLYAADLARDAARAAGWVGVVEGYTDVIAAHQAGMANVVGTLGTALGDDHLTQLRRLADRVVLIFDGDEAGLKAADRSIELFLGQSIDVRVVALPDGLDPCDFVQTRGVEALSALVTSAPDPLGYAIARAAARFDVASVDGARQAATWVLSLVAKVPAHNRGGLDVAIAKSLDVLGQKLRLPVEDLQRELGRLRRAARSAPAAAPGSQPEPPAPIRPDQLDPLDRELVQILLNEPEATSLVVTRVTPEVVGHPALRAIVDTCLSLHGDGQPADFERVSNRLADPAVRSLAAGLLLPLDPAPLPERVRPAPWQERLAGVLAQLAERARRERLRELKRSLDEIDRQALPDEYRAVWREYLGLLNQTTDAATKHAS